MAKKQKGRPPGPKKQGRQNKKAKPKKVSPLRSIIMHNYMLRANNSCAFRTVFAGHSLTKIWTTNVRDFDVTRFIDHVLDGDRSASVGTLVFAKYGEPGVLVLRALIPRAHRQMYGLADFDVAAKSKGRPPTTGDTGAQATDAEIDKADGLTNLFDDLIDGATQSDDRDG